MIVERTPLNITQNMKNFAAELGCGEPFYVPIRPGDGFGIDFQCLPGKCHINTAAAVQLVGGKAICGWTIWENKNGDWVDG